MLASAILKTIRYVPKSCFAKQKSLSVLSDKAEFSRLTKKRPVSEILQKMPRFSSHIQAKKFKPLLSSTRDSQLSPGDLSQSQPRKLQAQTSNSVSATSTSHSPTRLKQQVQSDPFLEGNTEISKVVFDSGSPLRFWVYADTVALFDLQSVIQVLLLAIRQICISVMMDQDLLSKGVLGPGDFSPEVGSRVLAMYPLDSLVYRARVELILKVGETDLFRLEIIMMHNCLIHCLLSLRFVDYGTRFDGLQHCDLHPWDSILDTVPPQASACSFFGMPVKLRDKNSFSCE
jgi:hypothetical protein